MCVLYTYGLFSLHAPISDIAAQTKPGTGGREAEWVMRAGQAPDGLGRFGAACCTPPPPPSIWTHSGALHYETYLSTGFPLSLGLLPLDDSLSWTDDQRAWHTSCHTTSLASPTGQAHLTPSSSTPHDLTAAKGLIGLLEAS